MARVMFVCRAFYDCFLNDSLMRQILQHTHRKKHYFGRFMVRLNERIIRLALSVPGYDPNVYDSELFFQACLKNRLDILEIILKDGRVDPSFQQNHAFFNSFSKGHL
jgi:hypothetical protein